MKTQKFYIRGLMPGGNDITNINRGNRFAANNFKKTWDKVVFFSIRRARLKPYTKPVKINITWIEKNKKRDKDNIEGAKKYIMDGLVKSQIINKDGWKDVVGFGEPKFIVNAARPGVIVEIKEVNNLEKGE